MADADIEIQETLGHANYQVTTDVLDELKKATAENATKLVPRRAIHAA